MMLTKLTPVLTAFVIAFVVQIHAHGDAHHHYEEEDEGEFDDYEEGVTRVKKHAAPETFLDFVEYLAPVLKYYVVLGALFIGARYFNRMLEAEGNLREKELQKRPNLSHDLMRDSEEEEEDDEEDDESSSDGGKKSKKQQAVAVNAKAAAKKSVQGEEDEVYEEFTTDGTRLVKMTESELKERKKKSKNHPLFKGLQKIEEELKQKKEADAEEEKVSWNELHHSMLKRYQQKYPEHGLRVQKDDDYDDEFKELLKKHNIDPEEIRREIKKDA